MWYETDPLAAPCLSFPTVKQMGLTWPKGSHVEGRSQSPTVTEQLSLLLYVLYLPAAFRWKKEVRNLKESWGEGGLGMKTTRQGFPKAFSRWNVPCH